MPHKVEKEKNSGPFLLMRRLTRFFLWGLLVFIAISAFKEMSGSNTHARPAAKQTVLQEIK